jgi:CelD/BcsL family acetyltransferase involved in cellulose biosynthesis
MPRLEYRKTLSKRQEGRESDLRTATESESELRSVGLPPFSNSVDQASSAMAYTTQLISNRKDFLALKPEWVRFSRGPVDGTTLFNDHQFIQSLLVGDERLEPFVVILRQSEEIVAIAPFVLRAAPFGLWLSVRQIASFPARILDGCGGDFLLTRDGERPQKVAAIFARLETERQRFDLIRYQALSPQSPIWHHVQSSDSSFHLLPMHRQLEHRHLIDLKGSFEEYMGTLSRSTRKSLGRQWRRVHQDPALAARVERIMAAAEVDSFLRAVDRVVENTWQAKTFGLSKRSTPSGRERFKLLARTGLLRSYLLHFNETPVAFELGFQYQSEYLSHATGYDQRYKDYGPGAVLLIDVLQDLFVAEGISLFDFGFGELAQKRSLSHRQDPVASVVIVRHSRWRIIVQTQRLLNRLYSDVRKLLIHSRLDRFVRRLLKRQR